MGRRDTLGRLGRRDTLEAGEEGHREAGEEDTLVHIEGWGGGTYWDTLRAGEEDILGHIEGWGGGRHWNTLGRLGRRRGTE